MTMATSMKHIMAVVGRELRRLAFHGEYSTIKSWGPNQTFYTHRLDFYHHSKTNSILFHYKASIIELIFILK